MRGGVRTVEWEGKGGGAGGGGRAGEGGGKRGTFLVLSVKGVGGGGRENGGGFLLMCVPALWAEARHLYGHVSRTIILHHRPLEPDRATRLRLCVFTLRYKGLYHTRAALGCFHTSNR